MRSRRASRRSARRGGLGGGGRHAAPGAPAGVETLRAAGAAGVVVLHCVSEYPAAAADANLRAMATIADRVGCPVGYSDPTEGDEVALAAAALGACVLEKHLTLDRSLPGPDQRASLEPDELRGLVAAVRRVESA